MYTTRKSKRDYVSIFKSVDLLHYFGIWTPNHFKVFYSAKKAKKKIIISPLGALEPWSMLQKRFKKKGLPHRVVNAGVSGDTTAGGLRRIHGILKQKPDIVILALGSNDGLRGFPPAEIKKNLEAIIKICLENKTMVLLAGMKIPPNYGPKYTGEFKAIYPRLAKRYDLFFIPFLLEGVAGKRGLNQADGIHPNPRGVDEIVKRILPMVVKLVR